MAYWHECDIFDKNIHNLCDYSYLMIDDGLKTVCLSKTSPEEFVSDDIEIWFDELFLRKAANAFSKQCEDYYAKKFNLVAFIW